MANLKEVKNRIVSVSSTQQITSAMKMVAAAKLKRAQDRITQMRPYSEKLTGILQSVTAGVDDAGENSYGEVRDKKKALIVVVTSDRGLCGAFNSNIFKATLALIDEKYSATEDRTKVDVDIMPLGKKAYEYFKKRGFSMASDHYEIFGNLSFETAKAAAEFAMKSFAEGNYDEVQLVYNEFKNVATQILRKEQFLPVVSASKDEIKEQKTPGAGLDYIYEPSVQYIVEELIPKSLRIQFYKSVLESNASEHGARMTAMSQATDNAGDLLKELKLTYNRSRQAAITTEILEIVGGAEALANDG